jgi:hypothetical protein
VASIFSKRLPIVPLLIADQSIRGASSTESASIGNAGHPHAGGLRSRRCLELLEMLRSKKEDKRHACPSSSTPMSSPLHSLMLASPIVYSSPAKWSIHFNNMSAFCYLINRI